MGRERENEWLKSTYNRKYIKQTLEKLKKDIEKFIVLLTMTDRTWRQKVIIDTKDLNGTTNLYEESHIYITFHTTTIKIQFSSVHGKNHEDRPYAKTLNKFQ